ncbi:amidase [Calothrix sp. NIES-4071]|nr:amidase [Calothrix sp. NIES-4071]BAZ59856.1 amidase [Calothrix sp. NIES-4105]
MDDLTFMPVHELARMIRERETSSLEVVDAYLQKIDKYNSQLNAICTLDAENARQNAKLADDATSHGESWGVLHGVPITIKDAFETAGLRTTAGYKPLKDYVPNQDATVVHSLRAAGAIILGKTNLANASGDYQGFNEIFPRVNNPWNLNYTPGGSSSGGAAAVAAGLSPLDICSDFGGSIRQPAHFCGIFGLKPTDRRVPTTGNLPVGVGSIRQMMTVGALARSVEDLKICLSIIAGADNRQPDIPPVPLDIPSKRNLEDLRIGWIDEISIWTVAEDIKLAVQTTVQKLRNAGAQIEREHLEFDFLAAWQIYYALSTYIFPLTQTQDFDYFRHNITFLLREATTGDKALRQISNIPNIAFPIGLNPTLKGYFEILQERDRLVSQMDRELEKWDVWLCPVAITPAFTHRPQGVAVEVDNRKVPYQMANGAYTVPFNLTGHPVVVIPIGQTKNGLPIGMQLVGKRWKEMELLSIAQKISEVTQSFEYPLGY